MSKRRLETRTRTLANEQRWGRGELSVWTTRPAIGELADAERTTSVTKQPPSVVVFLFPPLSFSFSFSSKLAHRREKEKKKKEKGHEQDATNCGIIQKRRK